MSLNNKTHNHSGVVYSYRHTTRKEFSFLSLKMRQYTQIIIHVPYGKWIQPFYLDSMLNEDIRIKTERTYKNSQRLSLEGHFNEYFQLYVPKDCQVDALDILDPAMMLDLITKFSIYDIATDGIYLNITLEDGVTTQSIRQIAAQVIEQFHDKLVQRPDRKGISKRLLKTHNSYRSLRLGRRKLPFYW